MSTPNDFAPDTGIGRFFVGFGIAAFITFLALGRSIDSSDWLEAVIPSVVVGLLVGAASAWGKRCFAFFVEFFGRYGP